MPQDPTQDKIKTLFEAAKRMRTNALRSNISRVMRIVTRYDPEHDLTPDGPQVTWAEAILADTVMSLTAKVEELGQRVKTLENAAAK